MIRIIGDFWEDHVPRSIQIDSTGRSWEDIEYVLRGEFNTEVRVGRADGTFSYCVKFDDPRHELLFKIKYSEYIL